MKASLHHLLSALALAISSSIKMVDHFMERFGARSAPVPADEITWAKNWLVQHIKNTDFQYGGTMPHPVPRPYDWDESFEEKETICL